MDYRRAVARLKSMLEEHVEDVMQFDAKPQTIFLNSRYAVHGHGPDCLSVPIRLAIDGAIVQALINSDATRQRLFQEHFKRMLEKRLSDYDIDNGAPICGTTATFDVIVDASDMKSFYDALNS